MELLVVLAAVAIGAYFFLRSNTRRGAETVRAYVYLGGIMAGRTPEEANRAAAIDMSNAPTEVLRAAMAAVKTEYGGKQLPMIGEAYRLGMQPKMSNEYVATAKAKAAEVSLPETPEWVMPFVLYHVAWEMSVAGRGSMPSSVVALASLDGHQHLDLLASLQNYLSYAYKRDRQAGDDLLAIREARDFLQAELRTLNTPLATKRFIRKTHKRDTGLDIDDAELERQFGQISADVKSNDDAGRKLRNILLADSVTDLFQTRHQKQIDVFVSELSAHFATAS